MSRPLPKPFYFALGFDASTSSIVILGSAQTKEDAEKCFQRMPDAVSYLAINMIVPETKILAKQLQDWLNHECGMVPVECLQLVREFGKVVQELLDEIADAKDWKRR